MSLSTVEPQPSSQQFSKRVRTEGGASMAPVQETVMMEPENDSHHRQVQQTVAAHIKRPKPNERIMLRTRSVKGSEGSGPQLYMGSNPWP